LEILNKYFIKLLSKNIFGGDFMTKCITDIISVSLMIMGVIYLAENKDKLMKKMKKPMNQMLNNS
jgi:hypothetical protein